MESQTLVSICCLTYNHELYIEEAINSFVNQKTSFKFEIIVFDDCSTDSTTQIVNKFKLQYPDLIKIILPQENTFSKGKTSFYDLILASKGKYIACCEGDDYWISENKLQEQFDVLEKNRNISICFHPSYTLLNDELKDLKYGYYGEHYSIQPVKDVIKSSSGYIPMGSIMIRSSWFKKFLNTYPDFFSKSLWHSTIQILGASAGGAAYIPKYYSVYRFMHPSSWSYMNKISIDNRIKNFESFVYRNRRLRQILPNSYKIYFDYVFLRRIASFTLKEKISYKKKVKIIKSIFLKL